MTFGAEIWGPPLIQAAASIGSGYLAGKGAAPKETKLQKTQRKLVDRLIESLTGSGPYSNLFNMDEKAFQRSFVEPAQAMFRNRIAPQIQQQYIASGQQRGTGLDDQLLRAGVDLDSMLNQYLYQAQQDAMNRKQNALSSILGMGAGAPNMPTSGQDIMSSLGGYLSSPGFANMSANLFRASPNAGAPPTSSAPSNFPNAFSPRRGYERDWMDYKLGDQRWGQL